METKDLEVTGELIFNGSSFALKQRRTAIGRAADNDLVLSDERVSRHHAVLEVDPGAKLRITDLGSGNGTLIGDRRLRSESALVSDGDTLTLGRTVIRVSLQPAVAAPPQAQPTEVATGGAVTQLPPQPRPDAQPEPLVPPAPQPPLAAEPQPPVAPEPRPAANVPPANTPPANTPPLPPLTPPFYETQQRAGRSRIRSAPSGITSFVRQTKRRLRIATGVAIASVLVAFAGAAVGVLAATGRFSSKPRPPLTVSQIIQRSRPSVVFISALNGQGNGATGSGWVLNARKGEIVTNGHVVEGGPKLTVRLPGGKPRPAQLVAVNRCEDVALIRVSDTSGLRTLPQGRQQNVQAGDSTIALGFPFSSATDSTDLTDTTGVVSVVRTHALFYPDVTETDAAINPGNSGGPLLNSHGRIIGMDTFGATQGQNQGYAISINQINKLLPTLRAGTNQGWAGLALEYDESGTDQPDIQTHTQQLFGPEITGVYPGSTTDVITGDTDSYKQYLVAINGVPFVPPDEVGQDQDQLGDPLPTGPNGKQLPANSDGYCSAVSNYKKGQQTKVTILDVRSNDTGEDGQTTLTFK